MQDDRSEELHISKLEIALVVGVIGCMLFATWEVSRLLADDWLRGWMQGDPWLRRRVVLYGVAFTMSIASLLTTTAFAGRLGRFGRTVSRAFLWYGTLLLLSTIATFVFDCLPEVAAGFGGAGMFMAAIYVLQQPLFCPGEVHRSLLPRLWPACAEHHVKAGSRALIHTSLEG